MKSAENIERLIRKFCAVKKASVKTTDKMDERILNDALAAYDKSKNIESAEHQSNIGRIIRRILF